MATIADLENAPVLMLDGKFGMVIRVPTEKHPMVGIQVPDEEDIRWRVPSRIVGEPLMEIEGVKR